MENNTFKRPLYFYACILFLFSVLLAYVEERLITCVLAIFAVLLFLFYLRMVSVRQIAFSLAIILISSIFGFTYKMNFNKLDNNLYNLGSQAVCSGFFYCDNPFYDGKMYFQSKDFGKILLNTNLAGIKSMGIKPGSDYKIKIKLEKISNMTNPGTFDYGVYQSLKGCYYKGDVQTIEILEGKKSLREIYENLRNAVIYQIAERLDRFNDGKSFGTSVGMIMGFDDFIDHDTMNEYFLAGTIHILTVSGFHFALMYYLINQILSRFEIHYKFKLFLNLIFVLFLLIICGFKFAPFRAGLSMIILLTAPLLNRKFDLISACSFFVIWELILNPYMVYDMSLTLTFLSCVGISSIYTFMRFDSTDWKGKFTGKLIEGLNGIILTLSIQFALFIPIVNSNNTVNIISFISSFLGGLVSGVFMTFEIIMLVLGPKSSLITSMASQIACGLDAALALVNNLYSFVPRVVFFTPNLKLITMTAIASLIFYMILRQNTLWTEQGILKGLRSVVMIFIILGAGGLWLFAEKEVLEIRFFDVGQGDSCLITSPEGKSAIIDFGKPQVKTEDMLLKSGVIKTEYGLVTHRHGDHLGGYENLGDKTHKPQLLELGEGESLELGQGVKIKCIYDRFNSMEEDENKNCKVYLVSYGGFDALITGDIGFDEELELINKKKIERQIEVLKVAHHGSHFSSDMGFLNAIKPIVSIISVGRNYYGHPTERVMNDIIGTGSKLYRTDKNGAIILRSDGVSFQAHRLK